MSTFQIQTDKVENKDLKEIVHVSEESVSIDDLFTKE